MPRPDAPDRDARIRELEDALLEIIALVPDYEQSREIADSRGSEVANALTVGAWRAGELARGALGEAIVEAMLPDSNAGLVPNLRELRAISTRAFLATREWLTGDGWTVFVAPAQGPISPFTRAEDAKFAASARRDVLTLLREIERLGRLLAATQVEAHELRRLTDCLNRLAVSEISKHQDISYDEARRAVDGWIEENYG